MKSQELDIKATTFLKGVAIIAVVLLHTLSSIHGAYSSANLPWIVILDQSARFCVPLFVALSGYALMRKYSSKLDLLPFFKKRVLRLIPLYVLWSIVFLVALSGGHLDLSNPKLLINFGQNLLLGQADYQLYFVPMILTLYLLFPILRRLVRWAPQVALGLAILVQLITFTLLMPLVVNHLPSSLSFLNYNQYLIFISWIAYFVLGMWLAGNQVVKVPQKLTRIFGLMLSVGLVLATFGALNAMSHGTDSNPALRFTRFPIFIYTFGFVGLTVLLRSKVLKLSKPVLNVVGYIGEQSFLIYLSHTLVLRIIFSSIYGETTLANLGLVSISFLVGIFLSKYL